MAEKLCKWCAEPVGTPFYPGQPPDVCTGCFETIMDEDEFLKQNGIDFDEVPYR